MEANPEIANPSAIYVGQILQIPGSAPRPADSIDVNGYAYYTMNKDTLARTLPDLTYLSIFSHDARPTGRLADIADRSVIGAARSGGAGPIMVVTNIREAATSTAGWPAGCHRCPHPQPPAAEHCGYGGGEKLLRCGHRL